MDCWTVYHITALLASWFVTSTYLLIFCLVLCSQLCWLFHGFQNMLRSFLSYHVVSNTLCQTAPLSAFDGVQKVPCRQTCQKLAFNLLSALY